MRKRCLITCCVTALLTLLPFMVVGPVATAQGSRAAALGEVQIDGVLEIVVEDGPTGSRTLHFLKSADRRHALQFPGNPPAQLRTGDHLRVRGVHGGGPTTHGSPTTSVPVLALSTDSTSVQTVTPAPVPTTLGARQTLVVLVNFQDNPVQPQTVAQVRSLVFEALSGFLRENSFQQTWLSGDVYGWYTIPVASTTCDTPAIEGEANNAAAAAGADLSQYSHFVYIFPTTNACTFAGLAWVGGSPTRAFINGVFSLRVIGHEFGHNLGLLHSHALHCDASPLGGTCTNLDNGDGADIMGTRPAHFNAYQKERLGWLNAGSSPPITTVQTNGTYTLDPYEPSGMNPKALKIPKGTDPTTGAKTWYYVEYRQPLGADSVLAGVGNLVQGVTIRLGTEDASASSVLLDMTPNSNTTYAINDLEDGALVPGRSFTDPEAGVTISTQWATPGTAGVSVSLSTPSCVHANPTVTVAPATQSGGAGTPVTYTVSVANGDGAGCTASSFSLQATAPSGWTATLAAPALTVSPGASVATTLTVTPSPAATNGSYAIGVTATNSGVAGSTAATTATYVVGAAVSVAVQTDKPSYTRSQTVVVTAKVTSGATAVAGAAVVFTVTKPTGAVTTAKATTGADGTAAYKLRLKKQDPVGPYQVGAVATQGALYGSATTWFTVQ